MQRMRGDPWSITSQREYQNGVGTISAATRFVGNSFDLPSVFHDFGLVELTARGDSRTWVYGLSTCFMPTAASLIRDYPLFTRNNASIRLNAKDGRLISVNVTARPTGQVDDMRGEWAMTLVPFRTKDEIKEYDQYITNPPDIPVVLRTHGVKTDRATRCLRISLSPKHSDGDIGMYQPLDRELFAVIIAYRSAARNDYVTAFKAQTFSVVVDFETTIALRAYTMLDIEEVSLAIKASSRQDSTNEDEDQGPDDWVVVPSHTT